MQIKFFCWSQEILNMLVLITIMVFTIQLSLIEI